MIKADTIVTTPNPDAVVSTVNQVVEQPRNYGPTLNELIAQAFKGHKYKPPVMFCSEEYIKTFDEALKDYHG